MEIVNAFYLETDFVHYCTRCVLFRISHLPFDHFVSDVLEDSDHFIAANTANFAVLSFTRETIGTEENVKLEL